MLDQCYRKCITSHADSDLTKGEQACTDRCIIKWTEVAKMVQTRSQLMFEQQAKQQQSLMEAQKKQ